MKTFFAISAVLAVLSLDQASAMKSYLKKFPNGDLAFTQGLGHVSDSDTGLNDFGKLYSSKDGDWAAMCKEKFPGKDFTVGAAFGDPCCTWKSGGKPDFTVTPFTVPTKGETCAADKPSTPAASSAAPAPSSPAAGSTAPTPAAPGGADQNKGKPSTPAPTTASPAGNAAPSATPSPAAGNSTTLAPGGKPSGGASPLPGSKCGVKKEAKSLDDDSEDDDSVVDWRKDY